MCRKHISSILILHAFILAAFLVISLMPLHVASAEVIYDSKTFSKSTILRRTSQPYYFSGRITVPKGVTVTVEKGTKVFVDGNILIKGKFVFQGEKDAPISIRNSSYDPSAYSSSPESFTVVGGDLSFYNVDIKNMPALVQAYSSSTVLMANVHAEDVGILNGQSMVTMFNDSLLSIKDSSFKNIVSGTGLEVFNESSALIERSSFEGVGSNVSISVHDGKNPNTNYPKLESTVLIRDSHFYGQSDIAEGSGAERIITRKGLEIFSGAYGQLDSATFEGFSEAGISTFAGARIEISDSIFTKNKNGITSYGSYINISNSEIFENTEHGAITYDGTVDASNNWWGSETGPHSVMTNPAGKGDIYEGNANVSPWKLEKSKKKVKCCSSVLFIPGLEGSRIYKKGLFAENQLWEPNSNSDISKLYLTKDGYSADKTLYFRDIIDRTNIVFGGNDDIEIYRGLIRALGGLSFNFSIEDWQFAAYDWRMSPNSIVTEGTRYGAAAGSLAGQYKNMEDQIAQMAETSKTGKVTLLAHSYGGLVSKRLLAYLAQKGKIGLIDKVIFAAVPENGSPSSLFALLHGDNQDIGGGFIVNKNTMRRFAQNMPSVYALLPKTDSNLIYGLSATSTISIAVPSIKSVQDMYKFIFKEIPRPSDEHLSEINVPLVGNKKIMQDIDIESDPNFIKPQNDSAYQSIEFYNILGVGLDTVESIRYVKKTCQSLYTPPQLMSANCGLDHEPVYSQLGDGVVLADDVLESSAAASTASMPAGTPARWGEKYIFNLGEYNRKNNKNYGHANLISSPPVISTIMQVMLNNIGDYELPAYMTKHGGVRMGGAGGNGNGSDPAAASSSAGMALSAYQVKRYRVLIGDAVLASAQDSLGNAVGANFQLLSLNGSGANKETAKNLDIIPVQNTSPNSSFSHVGESYYMYTEKLPVHLDLKPDTGMLNSVAYGNSSSGSWIDGVAAQINLKIEEIDPWAPSQSQPGGSSQSGSSSAAGGSAPIASFENIPITEYSTAEVHINSPAASSSPTTPSSASSSSQAIMTVTDTYGGVYTNTATYASPYNFADSQPVDILSLIESIRATIQGSRLRTNFKQRYLLKLSAIRKNCSPLPEATNRIAKTYSRDTTVSLAAIIKDLNRTRALYYKGGMSKPEAAFLYSQFSKLSRAFGE